MRLCEWCAVELDPRSRSDRRFCSASCRARAHRNKRDAWRKDFVKLLERRQAAIEAGDLKALDEILAEAARFIGPAAIGRSA